MISLQNHFRFILDVFAPSSMLYFIVGLESELDIANCGQLKHNVGSKTWALVA